MYVGLSLFSEQDEAFKDLQILYWNCAISAAHTEIRVCEMCLHVL